MVNCNPVDFSSYYYPTVPSVLSSTNSSPSGDAAAAASCSPNSATASEISGKVEEEILDDEGEEGIASISSSPNIVAARKSMIAFMKENMAQRLDEIRKGVPSFTVLDALHLDLNIAKKIDDPEKARVIRTVYEQHYKTLAKVFKEFKFDIRRFESWLVKMSKVIGSQSIDHINLMQKTFLPDPDESRSIFQNNGYKERIEALEDFFKSLQKTWGSCQRQVVSLNDQKENLVFQAAKINKVILVLYRNCGSGHLTASEGIQQFLDKKGYKVHLLNGGECEDNFIVEDEIFSDMLVLRNRVKQLNPALIISTVAHHVPWLQLAYDLNVPALLVHTDYEIFRTLIEGEEFSKRPYVYENPSLVQYCVPHEHIDRNRAIIRDNTPNYNSLVNELGFPIRESFIRENDRNKVLHLRKELGICGEERVVMIMGHHYEPDRAMMIDLVKKLGESSLCFDFPICIVAVCGKNQEVGKEMETAFNRVPDRSGMRLKIEGYLNEEGMAKYMKVISRVAPFPGVLVSKRGGSTTAEAAEMGVYTIGLPTKPKEACNGEYLARHGLGELIQEDQFVNQIATLLKWDGDPDSVYRSPFDWRKNLEALVQRKLREAELATLRKFQFSTDKLL